MTVIVKLDSCAFYIRIRIRLFFHCQGRINVCVIISLSWFSKELKMTYRRTTGFVASSLYLLFTNQYLNCAAKLVLFGAGFSFAKTTRR